MVKLVPSLSRLSRLAFLFKWFNHHRLILQRFLFSGAASRAKIETNSRNSLHRPRKDESFETLVGSSRSQIAYVVWEAIWRYLGLITCHK